MRCKGLTTQTDVRRRGISLIEMIVSTVLLSAVLVAAVPMIGWSFQQRHLAQKRQLANQEVANIMETIATTPWAQVTSETLGQVKLSEAAQNELNNAKLEINLKQSESDIVSKQIILKLSWSDKMNRPIAPITLTTWMYEVAGAKP